MNADDKPYRVLLIADRRTTDCKLVRVERHLPSASVLGHDRGMFSLLTLCVLSMQPSRFCPPFVSFVLVTQHPSPHTLLLCLSGPLIAEVVLLASSKSLETFFLVVKHCILTKWQFCDLLVVLMFHRWKVQWLHPCHY